VSDYRQSYSADVNGSVAEVIRRLMRVRNLIGSNELRYSCSSPQCVPEFWAFVIDRDAAGNCLPGTPQMLIRYRADVINLRPAAVVILAGTNDIAGNTGPMTLEEIEGNYASLAELATAHHIRVIFSSVLPVHNYTPQSTNLFLQRSPEKIRDLNRWLRDYCSSNGCVYLDYFSAMVDPTGLLKKELAEDGLHPNASGYAIMAPLAEAAIQKALGTP